MRLYHKHFLRVIGRDNVAVIFACQYCSALQLYYRMTIQDSMLMPHRAALPPIRVK